MVLILGVLTLSLGWFLFPLVFPVVGLGYNAVTIGGPTSATIGQRLMGLEVPMGFGGKGTPIVAAFHALLFWLSLTIFCPILLWPLFDYGSAASMTFWPASWLSTAFNVG